jgi:hypothetical protein
MKMKAWTVFTLLTTLALVVGLHGCRRVALIGDSLLGCSRDQVVSAINSNNGNSWVYTEHIWNGCTAYNNPVNQKIYGDGIEAAFEYPDVAVLSFAANDMGRVANDVISIESATPGHTDTHKPSRDSRGNVYRNAGFQSSSTRRFCDQSKVRNAHGRMVLPLA